MDKVPLPYIPLPFPLILVQVLMNDSVESDVVIIASCIPTLQPVLELILGKRKLTSYSGSKKFKGSQQLHDYSYSHSASAGGKLSKNAKKHAGDMTITGVESQESILKDDMGGGGGHPLGAIRRTDNVTVEYESSGGGRDTERGSESW